MEETELQREKNYKIQTNIRRWGNSQGIRLSKEIMTQTTGVILCDRTKMLDVKARNAQFKEECPEDIWNEANELVISFM